MRRFFAGITAATLALSLFACSSAPEIGNPPGAPENTQVSESLVEAPASFEVFGLLTVAEIEISAEQTNEEIAEDIVTAFSNWKMSGANREMFDQQFEGDNAYLGLSEYIAKVSEISDPVYKEALFGDNVSNPLFQEAIDFNEMQHGQVLNAHYKTYSTADLAPYFSIQKFVSLQNVVERDDGTVTMYIDTVREDNGDKNMVDGTGTGTHTRANYVISKVGGVIKIVEPPLYVDQ